MGGACLWSFERHALIARECLNALPQHRARRFAASVIAKVVYGVADGLCHEQRWYVSHVGDPPVFQVSGRASAELLDAFHQSLLFRVREAALPSKCSTADVLYVTDVLFLHVQNVARTRTRGVRARW